MDIAVAQDEVTEQFLQRLDESGFLDYPLMNRIEGRIGSNDQLERYIAVLIHKLEERQFRDAWLTRRIDRLLTLRQRLERYEQSEATSPDEEGEPSPPA